MRSRFALAWVAGFLAGGCGLLIGLEDRELPAAGGPDATADVVVADTSTTQPDGTLPPDSAPPDAALDAAPDVDADSCACAAGCTAEGTCRDDLLSIGLGRTHACVVRTDGKLFCIGGNAFGQLATNTGGISETWVPVVVMNGAVEVRFLEIAAGPNSNCAISRDNDLYCWGDNTFRQLAQPTGDKIFTPTKVTLTAKVKAVSVGHQATCAILDVASPAPNVACWGHSGSADLGLGTDPADGGDGGPHPIAVPQTVDLRAKSVHVLDTDDDRVGRACAIAETGDLPFCWGSGRHSEITEVPPSTMCNPTGAAEFACAYGPTAWGTNAARDIVNGVYDVCALELNDAGANNIRCRGTTAVYSTDDQCAAPATGFDITLPNGAGNPQRLVTSHATRCFVNETFDVWCFGGNSFFHAAREGSDECALDGGGVPPDRRPARPLQVTFLPDGGARDAGAGTPVKAKLLSIGRYSALVYTTDKRLVGWGTNQEGQLGTRPASAPTTGSCDFFEGRCQGPTVIPPPAFP